jgi:hypothetical protein
LQTAFVEFSHRCGLIQGLEIIITSALLFNNWDSVLAPQSVFGAVMVDVIARMKWAYRVVVISNLG